MPNSSFVQRLMQPLRDPLILISAHDGTIMATNKPGEDLCVRLGATSDLVGANYYEQTEVLGCKREDSAVWQAAHSEGRFAHHVEKPVRVLVLASAQDGNVLVSAWKPEDQAAAEWLHDWYSLGLKNAIQIEQLRKQAALAASLVADVEATSAEMMRTYTARADLFERMPCGLPHLAGPLRSV